MAKKSKRPPARKQQQQRRPQPRPGLPQRPLSSAPAADLTVDEVLETDDDYASGSLPIPDTDGPLPLPPAEEDEAPEPVPVGAGAGAAAGSAGRRRVGRIDPTAAAAATAGRQALRAQRGRGQSTAAMFEPLPPEDASIPFDRVPYVQADLRRVLVIAGMMVVLIVVANFVINAVVK